jgi:hypothetical protein
MRVTSSTLSTTSTRWVSCLPGMRGYPCRGRALRKKRTASPARRGREARTPAPAQAISLFEQALRVLNEEIDALKNRKMHLQDERFVAVEEHRDPIMWSRLGISDGPERRQRGVDPTLYRTYPPARTYPPEIQCPAPGPSTYRRSASTCSAVGGRRRPFVSPSSSPPRLSAWLPPLCASSARLSARSARRLASSARLSACSARRLASSALFSASSARLWAAPALFSAS